MPLGLRLNEGLGRTEVQRPGVGPDVGLTAALREKSERIVFRCHGSVRQPNCTHKGQERLEMAGNLYDLTSADEVTLM
jgi:hypothetical protein